MNVGPTHADGATMRRWMIAVGIFYLVLGIGLLPWVNDARIGIIGLEVFYDGGDLTRDDTAYRFLLDWIGVFGVTLLVLGPMLLVAAGHPVRNRTFAHLVIWHELAVGVISDAWFIIVHLVVIGTGIRALRRTPMPVAELADTGDGARAEAGIEVA